MGVFMYLEDRSIRIINIFLKSENYVSVEMLAERLKVSKRTIYNEIDSLNRVFIENNLGSIHQVRGLGYKLNDEQKEIIGSILEDSISYQIIDPENRVHLIYCIFLGLDSKIDIDLLVNITGVSRNTLFSDLKLIRSRMERYNLKLEYNSKSGYIVVGDLIQKRSLFMYHYMPLSNAIKDKDMIESLFVVNSINLNENLEKLKTIEDRLQTEYIEGALYNLAVLMSIDKLNEPNESTEINSVEEVINSTEYELINELFSNLSYFNKLYYSIHLLGSMKQIRGYNPKVFQFTDIAIEMVEKFQKLAAIEFTQVTLLVSNLSNHLSISMYRYKFGLHQSNPLLNQIKSQYEDVFEISNQVCDVIRNRLHVIVSESEVAYIALHFNSFIRRHNFYETNEDIIIVCPQGLSTSAMLKEEIESMNPMIRINQTISLKQFINIEKDLKAKYIISTVDLPTPKKYIKVDPVLSHADRQMLMRYFSLDNQNKYPISADKIMEVVRPYISDRDYDFLLNDLENYLTSLITKKATNSLSIGDVLSMSMVGIVRETVTWQEGIRLSCESLMRYGFVEKTYHKAVIEATEKFGAYMVLENGYMLVHASVNDGVNALGLSFTKFNKPFKIGNKKVDKVFSLSPIDQKQHLKIMGDLLNVFTNETLHILIDEANSEAEILELILQQVRV